MVDFFTISTRSSKRGVIEIYPKFIIGKSTDLMIRGGDFYAVWIEELGIWSTEEQDAINLIDKELDLYAKENRKNFDSNIKVLHLWDAESGMIDSWHKYCQKQMRDSFSMLDEKLVFSNTETNKKDYASKKLNYPLEEGSIESYNKLIGTLYSEEERRKIEWAIGSVVTGASKKLQKFLVLYGAAGTGKSTILNIIQQLFEGYYSVFDAKALGSSSNSFALEAFKSNPLVAIQHDGDLSKIEDNTRLNSLVSHEMMTVNEKFKSTYANRFKCFLFMGTNKPVKITDARSGIIRRLIDVSPSGNKLNPKEYKTIMNRIPFELGAIAHHCKEVFLEDVHAYDDYIPISMFGASNDFYNFMIDSYHIFKKEDGTTMKAAWEMYKTYCEEANVTYPFSQRIFKEELKNYFWEFNDRFNFDDGTRVRSYYSKFRTDKFEDSTSKPTKKEVKSNLIVFDNTESIFDEECSDCLAQYATRNETPNYEWDSVKTILSDLDTSKLHYVRVPENHIVIDFDIKDQNGEKSFDKNVEAASKWPPTYAELSKSGAGVHLHYIYSGDVSKLSRIYDDYIEIKVFNGKSSLRRKLTRCNNLPIATINSGLPLKGEKMINTEVVQTEKGLRTTIKKCLNKEIHPGTKPNVDFINKVLEDFYNSGAHYDVSDMKNSVFAFAANSTNQSDYCIKLVNNMHFKSEDISVPETNNDAKLVFYDVEVFPNLFLINWKIEGEGNKIVRMINPKPKDVEILMTYRLVGFNCRRYDNHILYAGLMGYTNEQLYNLSQRIISGDKNAFFGEAYNVSYTDIYDFSATKQSLKKFEIELGIHHQELGLPWDKPVPENMWTKVAEYCDNDVIATEAVFNYLSADWKARQILADVAGMTVNDTTNSLTTKIIFGNDKNPQRQFNYRNMGDESTIDKQIDEYTAFDKNGRPVFPGYTYDHGSSLYREEDPKEGGYVYAEPGMYFDVALLDVASMHPHSVLAEELFGPVYTQRFREIVEARMRIKHEELDKAKTLLDGKLAKYLTDESEAHILATVLKIPINSVYGLTSANFDNPFRDVRNKDNIVAKRGALFMINLKHEVQKRGFTVAHIKTDSIKIPNATPSIIKFVMDYGKLYGYTFEHEATYEKMCLVNDAVYIAKYKDGKHAGEWTATGTQFAVPYVFKKLFSKEPILFDDMCETKSVTTALYLDMNESLPDVSEYEEVKSYRLQFPDWTYEGPDASRKATKLLNMYADVSDEDLAKMASEGHNYIFIGKVGRFCPIKPGFGGGELMRESTDKQGNVKYSSATGAKGYRWLESEMVKDMKKEDTIDRSYYDKLVDGAAETISKYGDLEMFISNDPIYKNPIEDLPWFRDCGRPSCEGCKNFVNDGHNIECKLGYNVSDLKVINKIKK